MAKQALLRLAIIWLSVLTLALCMAVEGRLGLASCVIVPNAHQPQKDGSSKVFRSFMPPKAASAGAGRDRSELRRVPSGPDPLHHNASPKKPQTP